MAGPYYLRSTDGSDASDGLSWANAKATVAGVAAVIAAGEICYVSQAHAESTGASVTWFFPTTGVLPKFICADDSAEPPTAIATTGAIAVTGVGNDLTVNGNVYFFGVNFTVGDDFFFKPATSTSGVQRYESCVITAGVSSSTNNDIQIGGITSTTTTISVVDFINCTFNNGAGTSDTQFLVGHLECNMINCTIGSGAFDSSQLFSVSNQGRGAVFNLIGCDLSAYNGSLFGTNMASASVIRAIGCKIHASATVGSFTTSGDIHVQAGSADQFFNNTFVTRYGQADVDTGIVLNATYDGSTKYSYNVHCTTASAPITEPFRFPIATISEVDFTTDKTFTVEFVRDGSATAYQDDELWIEVEYNDITDNALRRTDATSRCGLLDTPANLTSSTADWQEGGADITGSFAKMKVAVTIDSTVAATGSVRIFVCFATGSASTDLYADPAVTVS